MNYYYELLKNMKEAIFQEKKSRKKKVEKLKNNVLPYTLSV